MMDLPASKWRKKEKMELSKLRQKCEAMKKDWDKFDWTKKIQRDKWGIPEKWNNTSK